MALGAGKAMDTLDVRESRSSLAGVLMAAALEGVGAYDFSKDLVPHVGDIPSSVEQVLSRVDAGIPGRLAEEAQAANLRPPRSAALGAATAGEFPAITPDAGVAGRRHPRADRPAQSGARARAQPVGETLALLDNKHVTFDATESPT